METRAVTKSLQTGGKIRKRPTFSAEKSEVKVHDLGAAKDVKGGTQSYKKPSGIMKTKHETV